MYCNFLLSWSKGVFVKHATGSDRTWTKNDIAGSDNSDNSDNSGLFQHKTCRWTSGGLCMCWLNYLWFSPAEVSSRSFSLSVSCFFSSGLMSPFVILSVGSSERHTDSVTKNIATQPKPPQRGDLTAACDDTCLAPDHTEINRIFHPFGMPCSRKRPFTEAVISVEV